MKLKIYLHYLNLISFEVILFRCNIIILLSPVLNELSSFANPLAANDAGTLSDL